MKIEKMGNNFIICEDGRCIASASTPLETAAIAASEKFAEGSWFWHCQIAKIILGSDPEMINHWESPFHHPEPGI